MLASSDENLKAAGHTTTNTQEAYQVPLSRPPTGFETHRAHASSIVADVLGLIAALAFPIFGAVVLSLDRRETGAEQRHYRNATTTVWKSPAVSPHQTPKMVMSSS